MKRSRAQFLYKIGEIQGFKMLLIVDKNIGGRSVTNDIENVVDDIAEKEGIDPRQYFIAYKDTDGNWDGWDYMTTGFFFFRDMLKQLPSSHSLAFASLQANLYLQH